MGVLANNRHETNTPQSSPEPHGARRAVRYAATRNAQTVIARQFPMLFAAPLTQAVVTQMQQGSSDDPQTVQ